VSRHGREKMESPAVGETTIKKMVCRVVPTQPHGQVFSIIVNMMLGFFALSTLVIKRRYFDRRKRSNQVFLLDIGRLAVAGAAAHTLNIALAWGLDSTGLEDQCKFYLVNYILDVFIGVPLSYFILLFTSVMAVKYGWSSISKRGFYGRPVSYIVWLKQTAEFTFSLALAKLILAIPLFAFRDEFEEIGAQLVAPVQAHPHFELFFVMILVPTTLNAVQFIIFDQLLSEESTTTLKFSESSESFPENESSTLIDGRGA